MREGVLYVGLMDGLAKGGSLLVQWLSAADSGGTGVRHIGRQDTATWQAGPNCHCWFLQSRLTRAQRISVSLLSQEKRLVHDYHFTQSHGSRADVSLKRDFYKLVYIVYSQTVWCMSPAGDSKLVCEPGLRDGNYDDYCCHSNTLKHTT